MAGLDSQGKNCSSELPNPEETQLWEGENESVRSRQLLFLQLLLFFAAYIWQTQWRLQERFDCDVAEKPKILKRFWQRTSRWG